MRRSGDERHQPPGDVLEPGELEAFKRRWRRRRARRRIQSRARKSRDECVLRWVVAVFALAFTAFVLTYAGLRLGWNVWPQPAQPGQSGSYGDAVGPFATVFSTLALSIAIYAAVMQRQELALQREESEDNRAEQEGQRLAMEAQVDALLRTAGAQERQTTAELRRQEQERIQHALTFYSQASELHDALFNMSESHQDNRRHEMHGELRRMTLPPLPMGGPLSLTGQCYMVREALQAFRSLSRVYLANNTHRGSLDEAFAVSRKRIQELEGELNRVRAANERENE